MFDRIFQWNHVGLVFTLFLYCWIFQMFVSIVQFQQSECILVCCFFIHLFCIYPAWVSLRFLGLWHDVFHYFWKNLTAISSNISSFSSSFLLLAFQLECVILSHSTWILCFSFLFVCFSLCFSLFLLTYLQVYWFFHSCFENID